MPLRNNLESYLHRLGVKFSENILNQLVLFAEMILEYNRSLNLVSKRDPESEILKQIADSSALTKFMAPRPGSTLLDIGSGGGLPGIVLKIFWPEISLVSLDSNPKKITFQAEAAKKLRLENCGFIDSQFQEYAPETKVDYITVKGVGKFKKILSYAGNVLQKNGKLLFYLGENQPEELKSIPQNLFELESDDLYNLPDGSINLHIIKLNKKQ